MGVEEPRQARRLGCDRCMHDSGRGMGRLCGTSGGGVGVSVEAPR